MPRTRSTSWVPTRPWVVVDRSAQRVRTANRTFRTSLSLSPPWLSTRRRQEWSLGHLRLSIGRIVSGKSSWYLGLEHATLQSMVPRIHRQGCSVRVLSVAADGPKYSASEAEDRPRGRPRRRRSGGVRQLGDVCGSHFRGARCSRVAMCRLGPAACSVEIGRCLPMPVHRHAFWLSSAAKAELQALRSCRRLGIGDNH